MAELKTKPTAISVDAFLESIENAAMRRDCLALVSIMKKVTRSKPVMWGHKIVGFGYCHYKYASGREGDWFLTGFSPRKNELTIYIMAGFDRFDTIMSRLGTYKTGKSCLYVKRLDDVDQKALTELINASTQYVAKLYSGR